MGEELFLVNSDTVVIDEITFGEQQTDVAYARTPNGIGAFDFKTPTFNENNDGGTTSLNEVNFDTDLLLVAPNPAKTYLLLQLQNSTERAMEVKLFDAYGRLVLEQSNTSTNMEVNVQSLGVGLYFIVVNERVGQKVIIAR